MSSNGHWSLTENVHDGIQPFNLIMPKELKIPLLISVPHCGTLLTTEFAERVASAEILTVPDTDWYVHELYSFAIAMDIPLIHAVYSRYVIDLNRPLPGEGSLYQNENRVTGLVPTHTFSKKPIYKSNRLPSEKDIQGRIDQFYRPYYTAIQETLDLMKKSFPVVMLYDGHSIRGQVSMIQEDAFQDYLPANRSGKTCPPSFVEAAESIISDRGQSFSSNSPFQGGNITRHFHEKNEGVLTFQMELSQRIYMDENSLAKGNPGWNETSDVLQTIIEEFAEMLLELNEETS